MMFSSGYNMDGDEFTRIDGSATPQVHGDGTEDDHNQGWGGYAVQKPLWGGLINGFQGDTASTPANRTSSIPSITINYEHSNCGGGPDRGQKTDFVVWHYLGEPGATNLKLTDSLDVGDEQSEKAHRYAVAGLTWTGSTASSYDRYEQQSPTADDDGHGPRVQQVERVRRQDSIRPTKA